MDPQSAYNDWTNKIEFDKSMIMLSKRCKNYFNNWIKDNVLHEFFHKVQDKYTESDIFLAEIEQNVTSFKSYEKIVEEKAADKYAKKAFEWLDS